MAARIGVIGSGVVGLATAVCLARRGYQVCVYSAPARYRPTSPVAGALWYPYAVNLSLEEERELAAPTFRFLAGEGVAEAVASGCRMVEGAEYFDETVDSRERRVAWWTTELPETGFRELTSDEIPASADALGPLRWGWTYRLPVVDMGKFLAWLRGLAVKAGVKFVDDFSVSRFKDVDQSVQAIIHCAGGWATHLTRDVHLFGLRGVVVHVAARHISGRLLFVERGKSASRSVYIIPHPEFAVLGGTAEQATADGQPWPIDDQRLWTPERETVAQIVERCAMLEPGLKHVAENLDALLRSGEVRALAGLRPRRRDRAPRIEIERQSRVPVIHNYGHGGAGVTLCWGSALKVAKILDSVI